MTALEIARAFIRLAAREQEVAYLTHLHLQKLIYYAQGWSLALRRNRLFLEPIEAWTHGPCVHSVYEAFKKHGSRPIPPKNVPPPTSLNRDEWAFVRSIWESYKKYSAIALRNKTHRERPWLEARKGHDASEPCEAEISQNTMMEFFQREYETFQLDGFALEDVLTMPPPSQVRRGKPFTKVLEEVGLRDASAP